MSMLPTGPRPPARPAWRLPAPARPAQRAGRVAGRGSGQSETSACGRLDPASSPGRLAPVAETAALGPDLPGRPEAEAWPAPGYRPQNQPGRPAPKGFFLDRYVY